MDLNEVKAILVNKKGGTFFPIRYKSTPAMKAPFKKLGFSVIKYTKNLVRTGVNYDNLSAVIKKRTSENYTTPPLCTNNNEWIVEDKIFYNSKTKKYSARFGFCVGYKASAEYKVYDKEGNEIPFNREYVVDSYWNKPSNERTVMNINIDNIIEIGQL